MIKLRLHKTIMCFFTLLFFISLIGSIEGLVLCFGANGHIHTEITFNGFDCGHLETSTSKGTDVNYLSKDNDTPTGQCTFCVDIPLSLDHILKKVDSSLPQLPHTKVPVISSALTIFSNISKFIMNTFSLNLLTFILPIFTILHSIILLL